MYFVTSSFNVMREISLPDAVTHNDCVLGVILVKRPANSLDVAGSVGCSASTDPDRFLAVRYGVAFSQQRQTAFRPTPWTFLGRWTVNVSCGTWYRVRGAAFVCIMPCLLTSTVSLQFLVIGNARAFILSLTEVHRFWASILLSPRGTIENRIRVSLFHAEIFTFRNTDCLFHDIDFQWEEVGPD